jgi:predicted RNase H-like HicB family nuclease
MNKYSFTILWSDEDKGYIATCPEFPGLSAFGENEEQALAEAKIALELFVETYAQEGKALPEPEIVQEYSGQFRVRLPKSLHQRIAQMAKNDNTSLNQFVVDALAERIGAKRLYGELVGEFKKVTEGLVLQNAGVAYQLLYLEGRPLEIERTVKTETIEKCIYSHKSGKEAH